VIVEFKEGDLRACDEFAEPETKSFPWSRSYTRDRWLGQLPSHSDHAALPSDVQRNLFDAIGRTIDDFGGTFRMTYVTILIFALRR
jgi:hypothetical protein